MSDQSELARAFVPVKSEDEARLLMKEALKTSASCIAWTKNQEKLVNSSVSYVDKDDGLYIWTPKEIDGKALVEELSSKNSLEFFFSMSLSHANIFFKTQLSGYDDDVLKFKYPKEIFKVQRRSAFRMPVPSGYTVYAEFSDVISPIELQKKKVFDVSAGGISILVKREEQAIYTKGLKIKGVTFTLQSRKMTVDTEVRYTKDLETGPKKDLIKVGLQFTQIRPADSDFIAAYILEESRKYFSKAFQ